MSQKRLKVDGTEEDEHDIIQIMREKLKNLQHHQEVTPNVKTELDRLVVHCDYLVDRRKLTREQLDAVESFQNNLCRCYINGVDAPKKENLYKVLRRLEGKTSIEFCLQISDCSKSEELTEALFEELTRDIKFVSDDKSPRIMFEIIRSGFQFEEAGMFTIAHLVKQLLIVILTSIIDCSRKLKRSLKTIICIRGFKFRIFSRRMTSDLIQVPENPEIIS
jgi:hypothetical protein